MTGTKLAYAAVVLGASSSQDGSEAAPTATPITEKATVAGDASERSTRSAESINPSATPATALTSKPQKSRQGDTVVSKVEKAKPHSRKETVQDGSNDMKKSELVLGVIV